MTTVIVGRRVSWATALSRPREPAIARRAAGAGRALTLIPGLRPVPTNAGCCEDAAPLGWSFGGALTRRSSAIGAIRRGPRRCAEPGSEAPARAPAERA